MRDVISIMVFGLGIGFDMRLIEKSFFDLLVNYRLVVIECLFVNFDIRLIELIVFVIMLVGVLYDRV